MWAQGFSPLLQTAGSRSFAPVVPMLQHQGIYYSPEGSLVMAPSLLCWQHRLITKGQSVGGIPGTALLPWDKGGFPSSTLAPEFNNKSSKTFSCGVVPRGGCASFSLSWLGCSSPKIPLLYIQGERQQHNGPWTSSWHKSPPNKLRSLLPVEAREGIWNSRKWDWVVGIHP